MESLSNIFHLILDVRKRILNPLLIFCIIQCILLKFVSFFQNHQLLRWLELALTQINHIFINMCVQPHFDCFLRFVRMHISQPYARSYESAVERVTYLWKCGWFEWALCESCVNWSSFIFLLVLGSKVGKISNSPWLNDKHYYFYLSLCFFSWKTRILH